MAALIAGGLWLGPDSARTQPTLPEILDPGPPREVEGQDPFQYAEEHVAYNAMTPEEQRRYLQLLGRDRTKPFTNEEYALARGLPVTLWGLAPEFTSASGLSHPYPDKRWWYSDEAQDRITPSELGTLQLLTGKRVPFPGMEPVVEYYERTGQNAFGPRNPNPEPRVPVVIVNEANSKGEARPGCAGCPPVANDPLYPGVPPGTYTVEEFRERFSEAAEHAGLNAPGRHREGCFANCATATAADRPAAQPRWLHPG